MKVYVDDAKNLPFPTFFGEREELPDELFDEEVFQFTESSISYA